MGVSWSERRARFERGWFAPALMGALKSRVEVLVRSWEDIMCWGGVRASFSPSESEATKGFSCGENTPLSASRALRLRADMVTARPFAMPLRGVAVGDSAAALFVTSPSVFPLLLLLTPLCSVGGPPTGTSGLLPLVRYLTGLDDPSIF